MKEAEANCCTTGDWIRQPSGHLEWTSKCHDWSITITSEGADEFEIVCAGDLWEFTDNFFGTEDEAKAYALDVLFGVPEEHGIASAVARAKSRSHAHSKGSSA